MKRNLLVFCAALLCSLQITFAQYANTTLSNLTPPTAVNTDLLPGVDQTLNLGSSDKGWGFLYFRGIQKLNIKLGF